MRKFLGASIVAFALLLGIGFAGVIGFADDFGDVEELPVFAVQEGLVWIGECVSTEETASQFQNADDCDDGITSLKLAPETRQAIEFHVTYPLTIDTAKWYVSFFLTLDKGLTWSDRVFVNLSLKELDPDLDGNIKISGSRFTINAFDASAMTRLTVLDRKLTPGIVNSRVWVFDGPVHGEVQDGIPVQDGLVSPTVAFGSGNRPSNPTPKDQQGTTTPHCSVNCDNSGGDENGGGQDDNEDEDEDEDNGHHNDHENCNSGNGNGDDDCDPGKSEGKNCGGDETSPDKCKDKKDKEDKKDD